MENVCDVQCLFSMSALPHIMYSVVLYIPYTSNRNNFMVFEVSRSYFISLKVSPSLPSQSQAQLAASAIFLNANYNELAHILHYIFLLEIFAIYNIVSANSNCLLCM